MPVTLSRYTITRKRHPTPRNRKRPRREPEALPFCCLTRGADPLQHGVRQRGSPPLGSHMSHNPPDQKPQAPFGAAG
jgi:hypothetical protein